MSLILYNIFLFFLRIGIPLASLFDTKARKWVRGRKNIFGRLEKAIPAGEKIIWVHCASLGEFEQGRPVIDRLKKDFPAHKILLTFFSPSGYEIQKNYPSADWVFYLPLDGPSNSRRFLRIVQPVLVVFVKYEFWFYYLKKIKYREIPLLLISALFREDMPFFKWYGGLQKKMLSRFDRLFVQNKSSKELLDGIGLAAITEVSGDTRFDRVLSIAGQFEPIPLIEKFVSGKRAIVAGSTWPEDEEIIQKAVALTGDADLKLIIAPHEIGQRHLSQLRSLFPKAILFSELQSHEDVGADILIIDNFGMLSRLYNYGMIGFIGGGFMKSGVHNVLEPAVYGRPVIFGPYYEKYAEAIGLVSANGAVTVKDATELKNALEIFLYDKVRYETAAAAAGNFVRQQAGATDKIISFIQEKRLLTS